MNISRMMLLLLLVAIMVTGARAADFLVGERENIVVFGDSITADGRYAQMLQNYIDAKYSERDIRVISAGSSGDTARGSQLRIDSSVLPWRPAWVLINLGINDMGRFTSAEYLQEYEMLMLRIRRDTGAKIGIMSFIYPDHANPDRAKEAAFIAGLQALAKKYNCLYIPCYEAFQRIHPTLPAGVKYAPDGIHPVQLGYHIFAQTILKSLNYRFNGKIVDIDMPVTRLISWDNKEPQKLIGKQFTLDLPDPLRITIVNYQPPTTTVPLAKGAMTIDGKLNDWALINPILLDKPEMQSSGVIRWGYEQRRSTAYCCYDKDGWYFALNVQTPVVLNTPQCDGVSRDCLELHLDLRSAEQRAAAKDSMIVFKAGSRVGQLLFAPATKEMPQGWAEMWAGDKELLAAASMASSLTNSGYILEIKIPAGLFPDEGLTPGKIYGLDISVDDVDRFSNWSELTQIRWSGSQYSFFSTLEFGRMTLGE